MKINLIQGLTAQNSPVQQSNQNQAQKSSTQACTNSTKLPNYQASFGMAQIDKEKLIAYKYLKQDENGNNALHNADIEKTKQIFKDLKDQPVILAAILSTHNKQYETPMGHAVGDEEFEQLLLGEVKRLAIETPELKDKETLELLRADYRKRDEDLQAAYDYLEKKSLHYDV